MMMHHRSNNLSAAASGLLNNGLCRVGFARCHCLMARWLMPRVVSLLLVEDDLQATRTRTGGSNSRILFPSTKEFVSYEYIFHLVRPHFYFSSLQYLIITVTLSASIFPIQVLLCSWCQDTFTLLPLLPYHFPASISFSFL